MDTLHMEPNSTGRLKQASGMTTYWFHSNNYPYLRVANILRSFSGAKKPRSAGMHSISILVLFRII